MNRIKDLVDLFCLHRYHRPIERTVELFRKEHVAVEEEKIIMIFSDIQKQEVEEGISFLSTSVKAEEVCKTLKESAKKMLQRGLHR